MKNVIVLILVLFVVSHVTAQGGYWSKINSGTNKRLLSISFGSPLVGYISGADSLLMKTNDGGKTWTVLSNSGFSFSPGGRDIVHINFVNTTTGFAIVSNFQYPAYQGTMYKTTNGGVNWTPVVSGNIAAYTTFFFNENNGYQAGSAFFSGQNLIKLANNVWTNQHNFSYLPEDFLYTVDFYDTNVGIAGGSQGFVYRTFNGGATWDTVKTPVDSTIHALRFVDHRTILGATDNSGGAIIISTDTGRTWQIDMNTLTFSYPMLNALVLSQKDSFVAVGRASFIPLGAIMSWTNGFAHLETTTHPMYSVAMSNDSIAFAVGDSGLIMSNLHSLLSITTTLDDLYLSIYPNPSKGTFTTAMQVPHTVTLSDITGKILYQNVQPARTHRITLSESAKGCYIVIIQPDRGRTISRMVVID